MEAGALGGGRVCLVGGRSTCLTVGVEAAFREKMEGTTFEFGVDFRTTLSGGAH